MLDLKFPFLDIYTESINEKLMKIGSNFVNSLIDESILRNIIFERDFENRDSLELLSYYNITEIMNNKNIEKVALELWSSNYDVKGNLMECSSALSTILYNTINKPRDLVDDYIFFNFKFRKFSEYSHHLFQFEVWKKSMKAKFLTEAFFLILLA